MTKRTLLLAASTALIAASTHVQADVLSIWNFNSYSLSGTTLNTNLIAGDATSGTVDRPLSFLLKSTKDFEYLAAGVGGTVNGSALNVNTSPFFSLSLTATSGAFDLESLNFIYTGDNKTSFLILVKTDADPDYIQIGSVYTITDGDQTKVAITLDWLDTLSSEVSNLDIRIYVDRFNNNTDVRYLKLDSFAINGTYISTSENSVPEPASLAILAVVSGGLLMSRKRK